MKDTLSSSILFLQDLSYVQQGYIVYAAVSHIVVPIGESKIMKTCHYFVP